MQYDIYGKPLAIPTPYVSPSQGGNQYVVPGSQTQPVASSSQPIQTLVSGGVKFSGGETIPSQNVIGSNNQNVSRLIQSQNLGANITNLNPVPQPAPTPQQSSGPSRGDIINAYRAMGWSDENAIMADYNATGGSKLNKSSGSSGPSAEELAIKGARNAFNSAYEPLFQQLDSMAGLIPGQQQTREGKVQDMYSSQLNELLGAKENSISGLDTSKQQVAQRQANSVRDIQENLRNMLQAGNVQLGVGGAGDSSAKDMYAFALSKAASRSSADVSNQAQEMYTQIDMQGNQIKATYDDNIAKLATWRDEQLASITSWAQDLLMNIESQKATAKGQQAQALAANETNIINNALSRLQQIDDQVVQWNQGIQEWALNRMAQIDDAKAKISGYGQYTPSDIVAQEIQGLGDFSSIQNNQLLGYNPWGKQKEETTNFLNSYGR